MSTTTDTRLVIFDCMATLVAVDQEPLHFLAFERALTEMRIVDIDESPLTDLVEHYPLIVGSGDTKAAEIILLVEGYIRGAWGSQLIPELVACKSRHFESLTGGAPALVHEPVLRVLRYLEESGYQLAIGTNSKREKVLNLIKGTELEEFFPEDRVFSARDESERKPSPKVFLLAADACKKDPRNCLVVGDAVLDGQAAKAAGMAWYAMLNFSSPMFRGAI